MAEVGVSEVEDENVKLSDVVGVNTVEVAAAAEEAEACWDVMETVDDTKIEEVFGVVTTVEDDSVLEPEAESVFEFEDELSEMEVVVDFVGVTPVPTAEFWRLML